MTTDNIILGNEKMRALIEKLPTSWDDFKTGDYMRTIEIEITQPAGDDDTEKQIANSDNLIKLIAVLLEIPYETVNEKMPIVVVTEMGKRLAFTAELPVPGKKESWFKDGEDVTYNEYTTLMSLLKDPVRNMRECVILLSRKPLTMDEVNAMSVQEVYTAFFTLRKYTLKSLRRSARKTALNLVRIQTRTAAQIVKNKARKILCKGN